MATKKRFLLVLSCLFSVIINVNCGQTASHSTALSSLQCGNSDLLSNCEKKQLQAFEKSFYPFLKKKCSTCHSNGPGIGKFANSNAVQAWIDFSSIGKVKIIDQALNASHQPGYTGPSNQSAIQNADEAYSLEESAFALCQSQSQQSCELGGSRYGLKTKPKGMKYSEQWNTMEYDYPLDFVEPVEEFNGKVTQFSIQYRLYNNNGKTVGYQLRRPKLKTTEDMKVEGLRIDYNFEIDPYLTTYINMNGYVSKSDDNLIESESETLGIVFDDSIDEIQLNHLAISLDGIEFKSKPERDVIDDDDDDTPIEEIPDTSYTELTSNGGLFKQNCSGCHSPQGGRQPHITSSNLATLKSGGYIKGGDSLGSKIYQRMTDPVAPMPPSGVLPSLQRRTIKKWIDDGAKANL
ncbi:MAG: hypothetical protein AAF202_11155 [Pseudomonadota bacterium]